MILLRNWIELAIVFVLLAGGAAAYFYAGRKVSDIESELIIRRKNEIKEKTEEET